MDVGRVEGRREESCNEEEASGERIGERGSSGPEQKGT